MRPGRRLAPLARLVLVLGALGSALVPFASALPALAQATVTVRITSTLEPAQLTVAQGTTVRWENADGTRHRIRATSGPAEFDGDLDPGQSFTFTFTQAGTYQYRDDRARTLANYWGTVVVTAGGAAPPASTPPGGGGTAPPPGGATGGATTAEVTMAGRAFTPSNVTIGAGGVVTWRNNDGREHTVTARDASFESGIMAGGATFQKTFAAAGTFSYFCAIHPDMTGTISVAGAGGAVPPPPPAGAPTPAATPKAPAAGASDVRIIDFGFTPAELQVAVGATVSWANTGVALHTVTARDGSFDSGYMSAGQTFSFAFASAGTFQYICSLHPNMTGSVVVGGAPGAPPPPVATPAPRAAAPPSDVRAIDFAFEPAQLRVDVGSTVTWSNAGVAPHTITARDGSFDSGTIKAGGTYSRRFDTPGTFQYLCGLHADMTGTIVVPDATGAVLAPQVLPRALTPQASTRASAGTTDVDVVDFGFAPQRVDISVGGTVRWVNSGVAPHTVTADDGSYDSGFLNRGEQFTRRFDREGSYAYLCTLHPGMTGSVVVGRASVGAGPAGTSPAGTRPKAPSTGAVQSGRSDAEMRDFSFEPARLIIQSGTTVAWKNVGVAPHTVTARDGSFDSGIKNAGESFEHRFEAPGTFDYFCIVHPAMIGTVEVLDGAGASSTAGGVRGDDGKREGEGGGGVSPALLVATAMAALLLGASVTYFTAVRSSRAAKP